MALSEEQKQSRAEARRLTAALKEEAQAHRREAKQRDWREKDMYLTRDQAAAGEPCRGCGLPVIDNLGGWPPLMKLTDQEQQEYDAAQAQFRELHPECHESRWSTEGSRASHCFLCCPPIPISDAQRETIRRLMGSFSPRREEELDIWTRTLTCGHKVEQSVHHANSGPSFSTQWCPECEITRGVVSSETTVEASSRRAEVEKQRDSEVRLAERAVAKAEKAAAEARRALKELRARS